MIHKSLFLTLNLSDSEPQRWFRAAAAQGDVSAQLNFAVMLYLRAADRKGREEAERYFRLAQKNNTYARSASTLGFNTLTELVDRSCRKTNRRQEPGEQLYVTFCAGCHGMNGIAAYGGSPSFALGERMEKSDAELLGTILRGHDIMPPWADKFPKEWLKHTLRFIRSLQAEFRYGILHVLRSPPLRYSVFGPMDPELSIYPAEDMHEYEDNIESFITLCSSAGRTTSIEESGSNRYPSFLSPEK